jgi:hypothetical protein
MKGGPLSGPTDRLNNYTYGVNPDRIKEDLVAKKPVMVNKQSNSIDRQYQIEQLTLGVLASEGSANTSQYGMYMAFARQIYGLERRIPGGAGLNNEVAVKLAAWKARGYSEPILIRIRNEVFSIPAPAAP